ncbi:hypothetical protein D1007_33911 [Hordeum vulgare]|uniref:DUF1618 domain-containing protein n=1 Tax=Hordeum vulgare subsp. vulgare TaxID=112509 RepID=A0A8I6X543_HORVV|nr:hypothetical protein D1007_33911 [Hordeum vulgare]
MPHQGYYEASLRPPALDDAPAAKVDWGEVLLDRVAYMADKKNHTSARCRFKRDLDGKEVSVEVTLCFAPPPRLSYFCCHACCPNDHGEKESRLFFREPFVFAAEGNLALITLCHGHIGPSVLQAKKSTYEYLVYQAASSPAGRGKPELTWVPHIPASMLPSTGVDCIPSSAIGVVPYNTNISTPAVALARPQGFPFTSPASILSPSVAVAALPKDEDDFDAYRIAALAYDFYHDSGNSPHGPYYLCMYDSKSKVWTRKPAAIPQPRLPSDYICDIDMVITIGGSSRGIMGWVDLWNGILFSDVLADHTPYSPLRYVSLPPPRQPQNCLPIALDIGCCFRDIVFVKDTGIVRFVDLQIHTDLNIPYSETPSGWTVVTWILEGLNEGLETWGGSCFRQEHELHSRDISDYNLPQSLFVTNPILSSHQDGLLYLRTHVSSSTSRNSKVIAVDIKHG